MNNFLKRTWCEIDLDALRHNFNLIKAKVKPETKIMSVVKANAYGHGIEHCAAELLKAGTDWFAVSNLEEALQLRKICPDTPILILGYTPPEYADELALNNISQAVLSLDYAKKLSENAVKSGVTVNVHIKVDTGMSRIGFVYHDNIADENAVDEIEEACKLPNLYNEGIFTHFAVADENDSGIVFTKVQFKLFTDIIDRLSRRGVSFPLRHCCNSAATLRNPEMHLDMVRPGIILYGLEPSREVEGMGEFIPCMSFKTVVSLVKKLENDTPISYGRTYYTTNPTEIATMPVGYADGLPRLLSNKLTVMINGQKAKLVGRICMDQCMADVTGLNVNAGDEVTIFGKDITVTDLADIIGTINYELVCNINKRVPRLYLSNAQIVAEENYTI